MYVRCRILARILIVILFGAVVRGWLRWLPGWMAGWLARWLLDWLAGCHWLDLAPAKNGGGAALMLMLRARQGWEGLHTAAL